MPGKIGLLRTVLDQLGLGEGHDEGQSGKGAGKPDPMQDGDLAKQTTDLFHFRKRLEHVLGDYRADTQGHVFILRLDRVREKLGDRWDKSSDRIHEGIEKIISRHLAGGDLFIRYDDTSYLLIFLTMGEQEGQLRCIAIAEDIANRLTGTESATEVVKPQGVTLGQDGQMGYVDLPPLKNIVEQTIRSLAERQSAPRAAQAPSHAAGPVQTPANPPQPAPPSPAPPKPPAEEPRFIPMDTPRTDLSRINFVYRPLLAVSTSVISTFLCIPTRRDSGGRFLSGNDVVDDRSNPAEIFDLDIAVLRNGAKEIRDLIARGGHSLIALPVNFETLAERRRRLEYTRIVDECLSGTEKRVIFELTDLPEGIPQNRLVELVSALKPRSRSIIARFSPEHSNFVAYRVAGLHAVGIDLYNSGKSETDLMKLMESFVQEAKKNQLKCYAEGIRSLSLFSIALTLGFDYIAGYALSAVANGAEEIHKFQLEEPYLAFLSAMRRQPPND